MAEAVQEQQQAPAPTQPQTGDQRGVPEPVARIEAILRAEKEPPAPPQEQTQEPEVPAGPNKQVESEEVTTEDARRMAEIPLDQLEAIELETTYKGDDGKDITEKLPVKALREGFMRQKDYQRKTAELARQREAQGETLRQAVESERTGYQTQLQQLQNLVIEAVAPELKDVNWNDLAANNPLEYVKVRNRADQVAQTLAQLQAKQKELSEKQSQEQAAAKQKLAVKAVEILQNDIPGWNDQLYQSLMKAGESYGYKPEEVGSWVDARAIKLLHKAHLYDQLQAEKKQPAPDKKVVTPPKVIKPGAQQQVSQRQQQEQGAMKQLRTSGKIEDAAAVIRGRL
jgi:hypothetical protein